jgi:DNA-binding NarL/FixJ family response regulator
MGVVGRALRIVLADDHPWYRGGLASLLERNGIDVVSQAGNGQAAIEAAQATTPDVIVMDLNMPGVSGLEATRRLATEPDGPPVLVISVSTSGPDVSEALDAGAAGYVLKDEPVETVVAAIRLVASGQQFLSSRIALG